VAKEASNALFSSDKVEAVIAGETEKPLLFDVRAVAEGSGV
jgi:hypothetical protein